MRIQLPSCAISPPPSESGYRPTCKCTVTEFPPCGRRPALRRRGAAAGWVRQLDEVGV